MVAEQLKPALSVEHLRVSYVQGKRRLPVLEDVSFVLNKGEIVTILGESGSGKSTCGKALMGVLPPSARIEGGKAELGDNIRIPFSAGGDGWEGVRGRRIAMVYQDAQLALNPVKTIRAHFQEAMKYHKLGTKKDIEQESHEMLKLLNFPDPERILESYSFELSGGMCQRVYIALILCLRPEVLIADEPTSALDVVSQKEVLRLIMAIKAKLQLSILLITHDIGVAYEMSDRVIVLEHGTIVEEGTAEEVLVHPGREYTKALMAARNLTSRPVAQQRNGEPLLRISGLSKTFGERGTGMRVLNHVDLELYQNEALGILGFSGCGKSTLARCVMGLEMPDGGQIFYHDKEITHLRGRKRGWLCQELQIVFQDARASLNPRRSALELVQEPLTYMRIGSGKEREQKACEYLRRVGIDEEAAQRKPPQLSTGQCQRIAIARALVVEPDVLVCDEAVSALDMILQKQILDLLLMLQVSLGFAVIMISHDIRVIRHFCERVAVMKAGHFVRVMSADELTIENSDGYTRELLTSELHVPCYGSSASQ